MRDTCDLKIGPVLGVNFGFILGTDYEICVWTEKRKLGLFLWYVITVRLIIMRNWCFLYSYENQEKELGILIADNDICYCFR